jgi:hypothetical protein
MHCGQLPIPFPVIRASASPLSTIIYAKNVKAFSSENTHINIIKLNKNRYNKQLITPGPSLTL